MRKLRDSGFPWLKEIPCNWKNETIRHLMVSRDGGAWGEEPKDESSGTICLRIADFDYSRGRFKKCSDEDLTRREYTKSQLSRLSLKAGDILVEKSGGGEKTPVGRSVYYGGEYGPVLFANFMERLRFDTTRIDPEYAEYWLRAWYACRCSSYYINQTTGIQNINLTLMLAKERIFYPSFSEQRKIIDYLDKRCGEIDALTADIQTQINTLEQYKRSVITETVTKGLNPDAEMKDSGIEWVGQIPMSWKVLKGKHLFAQRSLRGNSIELQLLSPTQRFGVIPQALYEELTGMSAVKLNEKADLSLLKTIHKRDFCISLRSFQGGFEYSEYEGVVSPAYQVFYPTVEIADGYYKYLFKEQGFIEKMNSYTMTLRDGKNIAFSDFGSTYVPYPPLREQAEIAAYLNKKCDQIDVLIAEKQQQIATLDEYKKSLIFEYVIGKKEVPLS